MKNFYYFDFGENWPTTLSYSTGSSAQFKNLTLIKKSSNFLCNISTSICIRKNYKNEEFLLF